MISVVVPVYNATPYFTDFLESITRQTYRDMEIILVDDGSTDDSYALCQEWEKKDSRIKAFHTENHGVSAARNYGLTKVSGEYVGFADPDDVLHPAMYQFLYDAITETSSDLALCPMQPFSDNDVPEIKNYSNYTIREVDDLLHYLPHFLKHYTGRVGSANNKLYSKKLIEGIQFPEGFYIEDLDYNIQVAVRIKKCVWIEEQLYFYRQHSKSATHASPAKCYTDYSLVLERQLKIIDSLNNKDLFQQHCDYVCDYLMKLYARLYSKGLYSDAQKVWTMYKKIRKTYSFYKPQLKILLKIYRKRLFPKLYIKIYES